MLEFIDFFDKFQFVKAAKYLILYTCGNEIENT